MKKAILAISLAALLKLAAGAETVLPGDAQRGAEIFRTQQCITCHSVNGEGGHSAPDLGKRTGRAYTPSMMAGLMWNHAPTMWSAMEKQGITRPVLDEQQAADLFAYFFAARYFERLGDAGRGRRLFVEKRCGDCHNLSSTGPEGARPVMTWESVSDPIALAQAMWSHAPQMTVALEKKKIKWPSLSSQELTDIVVYAQNLPQGKRMPPQFSPASPESGEKLFELKGCSECHRGSLALTNRFGARTLTDFAAAMWNHAPQMVQLPPGLSGDEMRRIVGYLWSIQFFDDRGSATRGKVVFEKKHCSSCHGQTVRRPTVVRPFSMVAALWQHGPSMLQEMKRKGVAWPRFNGSEMSDVLAYLNSQPKN
jgi:cytochrome c2